jgi:hypothetical protein
MVSKTHKVVFSLLLSCIALSAQARPPHDDGGARGERNGEEMAREHEERRLDRAVGQVRRETGGRVLSADVEQGNGERIRIKVLTPGGRVRTVTVDEDGRERE